LSWYTVAGVGAVTVAVRGTSRSNAISPDAAQAEAEHRLDQAVRTAGGLGYL
jgi:hypothetical protein